MPCIAVKLGDPFAVALNIKFLAGCAERRNKRQSLCAGADLFLLLAAELPRNKPYSAFIQRSAALWRVDLVRAHAEQICAQLFRAEIKLSERLDRVGVADYFVVFISCSFKNIFYRHDRSGLVVDQHDRNKNRIVVHRFGNVLSVNSSVYLRSDPDDLKALLFKPCRCLKHAAVLNGRNNDPFARTPLCICRSEQRGIVCLCSSACKEKLLACCAQGGRNALSRKLKLFFGVHSHKVERGRIPVYFGHYLIRLVRGGF